jgi:hypothetical protein
MNFTAVNDPPVLDPITVPATVLSSNTVSFTATATDVDLPQGASLTFSMSTPPAGATLNTNTGAFSWTPTWSKTGPNVYHFTVSVSDGSLTDFQEFTVTVQPQVVYLPVIFR